MEIDSRRNSLMQQLAVSIDFTEVPLPEMKKGDSIPSHDSDQSFTPVDDLLSEFSLRVPSRPRSNPLSNPKRRVNPPITPIKTEKRIANSENEVPEANSRLRKQKRKKYKPKVVDDGASGNKSTKSPITPDMKHNNPKAPPPDPSTPDPKQACMESKAPVTPTPKQDLKSLNRTGKIIADTYLRVEKFNPEMELNNDTVARPTRSVRQRLKFDHEDTVLIRSEETTTGTNPNLKKFSPSHDEVINQLQPLREGLDSGSLAPNKPVPHEESISGKSQSPETFIGITTSLNCSNMIKPVQLVACKPKFNLGDKTETVMHRECAGTDSKLKQSEIGKVKCLTEDMDRIRASYNLIYLSTLCPRGVKRGRPKNHEEIVSKMAYMKNPENSLVLYKEKKEKQRGIVDLDEDSVVEWNLLMGEDNGANSAPGANPEREENWRQQRENFRKMALRFIDKMKLIQGNRCFSEWKGSVVDSVVGAFLTQNVSDHLSSSAFISLCARFPRQQQDGNATWPECKSDSEWTKSCHAEKSTSVANIVDTHVEVRAKKKPKVGSKSCEANKANIQQKKGWKVGSEHIDWDALRKEAIQHGYTSEVRGVKTEDAADWDAVRQADVNEVAKAIHARGQDNVLAERIQNFLNRVVEDHGSIDLEWLRVTPGDKAKEYLLSIYGLGLKSVECVRLLTLHQVAFPVDTNVGRIAVRLGWVPLKPLPESLQMHLLELYPVMESIQKYLWPRLCKEDQKTLYELHYQMITFGKVFCTKSKPNCNACPLRMECKHFASAYARLKLPGPQEKQENKVVVWTRASTAFENASKSFSNATDVPTAQFAALLHNTSSEPIIEEPMTPEEEQIVEQIPDIEDLCFDDPDEIPTIKLNTESFVRNIEELVQKDDSKLQIEDISKALALLPPTAASIPRPQLKHSRHLRTVHQAYELPDGHPILRRLKFEERDPEDPSPYLLILYSPEKEVSNGKPCDCTSCNEAKCCGFLSKEEENIFVKCSFMIPCRTAMRGSFPLNGTYFQVNEVFADHYTARNPVLIRREEIWELKRHSIYVGSSVSTILKGLSTEEVQYCFWRGSVCVREFDRATRYPKPLGPWLHLLPTMRKKSQQTL
ncbi:demeter-like protein 3 [Rhynchospora pubera]|uniref:Demeter-like protein 3 n=1 Tax=Rhynchospora pubera TaxID=906938 RepID=A0AAV8G127_9POAL|nr:demeter-like protein 3 [Rhynchospora pubera]KAJ4798839.1 demeter-like protein 3 [Rhynchospora pubera]